MIELGHFLTAIFYIDLSVPPLGKASLKAMRIEISATSTIKKKSALVTLASKKEVLGKPSLPASIETLWKKAISNLGNDEWKADFEKWGDAEGEFFLFQAKKHAGLDALDSLRLSAYHMGKVLRNFPDKEIVLWLDNSTSAQIGAIIDGLHFEDFRFNVYKSKADKQVDRRYIMAVTQDILVDAQKKLKRAIPIHQNIRDMRYLINTPGSDLTPELFANEAQKRAKEFGVSCKIRTPAELKKEGFNGLITVGKGSIHGPRMVTLEYKPKGKTPHIAFVGKGVTFDTGGISLKPGNDMWEMKGDMAGAATVLGATLAIAALKLPIHITTVLTLAENAPGPGAVLPGDIFKARNGKTVMVENTDAEGRLVLSDGLYEAQSFKPMAVIDLATLTGSIVRAIGSAMSGLFTNNTELANLIVESGAKAGEKYWRMPMDKEYKSYIDDSVADMKNIGKAEAGSITAALFLEQFVNDDQNWAHLDIAGPAFLPQSWKYYGQGGTAWGLSTLVEIAERIAQGVKLSTPEKDT